MTQGHDEAARFVEIIDAGVANGNISIKDLEAIKREDGNLGISQNAELQILRATEAAARTAFSTSIKQHQAGMPLRKLLRMRLSPLNASKPN